MNISETVKPKGDIDVLIEYKDSRPDEKMFFHNNVLNKGKEALAASLANMVGDSFDFYIARMLFGTNGTAGGAPKSVSSSRNALFGTTIANKAVIANIRESTPKQVTLTSVLTFDDANGYIINEMALQMNNTDLFSMATFGDISKTNMMQITWNWRISFI